MFEKLKVKIENNACAVWTLTGRDGSEERKGLNSVCTHPAGGTASRSGASDADQRNERGWGLPCPNPAPFSRGSQLWAPGRA